MSKRALKLDIGCGGNKKPGFLGVDIQQCEGVDFVMDVCNLDFPDNSIEQVYSRRCIQHVDDRVALSEIYRVLKPKGTLTLIVASWRGWLFYKLGLSRSSGTYAYFHLYSDGKLKRILRDMGFIILLLEHIPSTRRFGYDIEIIAQKPSSSV